MRETLCLLTALLSLAAALLALLRARRQRRRIDALIDQAISGGFMGETFDESALSALEGKLSRFLSGCAAANRDLSRERERMAGLISDISHQTKTPAANILLYASLLEESLTGQRQEQAAAIRRQAEKLTFLLDTLMKGSRLEAGMITLHPEHRPLTPLLTETAAQVSAAAERRSVAVTLRPTGASACFDSRWTAEALYNIVDNAVKYTPAGGRVTLSVTAGELFCRIDVSDTGPGIPEAERPLVFQRFYRGMDCREVEGSGLGLYLAREIVQAEGGYVKVSCPAGGGSVFSVYLPS